MDIKSKAPYPANALSNFAPHPFVFDGVQCNSMEGFLQSLKFEKEHIQVEVCKLTGLAAKKRGANKDWKKQQILYWKGKSIDRHSDQYQDLLDCAYYALSHNKSFQKALVASGKSVLTHSIGKNNPKDTILTNSEFCSRLTKLRDTL